MTHQQINREPDWPHAPVHRLGEAGTYFLTVRTYNKLHHFKGRDRLIVLHRGLLSVAKAYGWQLEAWAVFSNHYHFVGHSPTGDSDAKSLSPMLAELHRKTSKWVNRLDMCPGRMVWHNFRESHLTYQKSYLARLNYTHNNAVKHGLVDNPAMYPFCSAGWFERTASPAQVKLINGIKTDKIKVDDDFDVSPDW